ncbi:hypothetical protein L7F22_002895 [Adiantum nelumboides]|nr:hypothetical protein [Adiantum nelumboides]
MIMHLSASTSAAAALLLLLPLLRLYAADAQSLSLPPLWSFSADLSFPASFSSLNSYTGIAPFSLFAPILSSPAFASGSKGFSLGFLSLFQSPSSPPSHISLSICLGVLQQQSSSNGGAPFLVPVWTLNTTTPLQQRGKLVKLQVDNNKQLLLADGDGTVVWSLSDVGSMQMQSNGNLVIYDSSNESIWQSFENPSDSLLQGQRLRMGMELTSRNNMYKVTMQAGGVAFYQVSTNPWPLVYWAYLPNKTLNNYFGDMRGAFSLDKSAPVNLTASLASPTCATLNTSLAYLVLDGDQYVAQDACANINRGLINTTVDLIRLDNDGMRRDYYVHELLNSSYVVTSSHADYRPCFSPNVCGAYGICSTSNTFGKALIHNCRKNVEVGLMGKEDWYFPKWAAKKTREGNIATLIDRRLVATCSEESNTCHQDGTMEQLKTAVRVALLCIQEEPEMRPTMTTVCGMLEGSIALPEDIPTVRVTQFPFHRIDSSGTIEVVQYPLEQRG